MSTHEIVLASFLLLFVISIDLFACGFSYGSTRTRVPLSRLVIIVIVGRIVVAGALLVGMMVGAYADPDITGWVTFSLFTLIGFLKIASWYSGRGKEKPARLITMRECVILALALSVDGLGVAFAVALDTMTVAFIVIITTIAIMTDTMIFKLGETLGGRVARRFDVSFLGGLILLGLGIAQLFL